MSRMDARRGALPAMISPLLLLLQLLLISSVLANAAALCPDVCKCSSNGYDAVCVGPGLDSVPNALSQSLSHLDLQNNLLGGVDVSGHIDQYRALRTLNLGHNNIQELATGLFSALPNLETLNITSNQLLLINNQAFLNLAQLATLDLSGNKLSSLDKGMVLGIRNLKFLNLSRNNIQDIGNVTFSHLQELRVLDLSHNNITSLESTAFSGLVSLEILRLQWNNLVDSFDMLGQWSISLKNILYIDISHNLIGTPDKVTFQDFTTLQELDISYNELTALPYGMLAEFSQLKVLNLGKNPIENITEIVFEHTPLLERLYMDNCTKLKHLPSNLFQPLNNLKYLNLTCNPHLRYLPTTLFSSLISLNVLDISHNNLTSLPEITFQNNNNLKQLYLSDNPFTCDCAIAWVKQLMDLRKDDERDSPLVKNYDSVHCIYAGNSTEVRLNHISENSLVCEAPILLSNYTDVHHPIGSSAFLSCNVYSIPTSVITWITPCKQTFVFHNHHPLATKHLLSRADVQPGAKFHENHPWHNSSSYYSEIPESERILLLDDGTLYIDYVQRHDGGPYTCIIKHPQDNLTLVVTLRLDHGSWNDIKNTSVIIGFGVAASFFTLAMAIWGIKVAANRCINQQKRQAIKNIIDNLDAYKTQQIGRIKGIGANRMGKFRDQYHFQLERLRDNYNQQMLRIRENCGQQMDKIKDNYGSHVGRIKDYSSNRLERLRDSYNTQIVRIREYGSLQLDRLRENYKLQQQHLIKLLETMNLDNCKTVIETDCVRAESMLFDSEVMIEPMDELPYLLEADPPSTGSDSELEYITASSNSETTSNAEDILENNDVDEVYEARAMQLLHGVVIQMPNEFIRENGETVPTDLLLPPAPILTLPEPWPNDEKAGAKETDSHSDTDITMPERQSQPHCKKKHRRPKDGTKGGNSGTAEVETLLTGDGLHQHNCDLPNTPLSRPEQESQSMV